jgi:small subunit ribosomal protein S6
MNRYETTIIITPVLADEDIKSTLQTYLDFLKNNGATNVEEENWGLRKMAYPIAKKNSGVYHLYEFSAPGDLIDKLELAFRRDENILRFMTVKFDKYGVEYNARRRKGEVGRFKNKSIKEKEASNG